VATKAAVVIMTDTETHADSARAANALTTAYEFKEAGAVSFGVREEVQASGVPLLAEYRGHQSLRKLVTEGYQIITF
jgi:hypothetical protein